ncbi:MAG TPA: LLM class F420-dependent oxidoreductase [Dehalococcoidia bacterium]|nr:LLM class F420-dependent oxidoreductase [Dehalococcoidia bacterium]
MEIGVTFPQTEIGSDPAVLRDYAQAAEALDFNFLLAYDHVLGADASTRPDWGGRYTSESQFHEPLVMFGFMAALTSKIEFVTGILILPQRQTALVAKQAAEVDVLSAGRLKLGIGLGWNAVEYEALGEDFHTRGRRVEEQVQLLRRLWTEPIVDFEGKWHRIDRAGLNPLPVQRPIPLLMGGLSDKVLERAARIADGWFPILRNDEGVAALPGQIAFLRERVASFGRDPKSFEIRVQAGFSSTTPDQWASEVDIYRNLGVDYLCFSTMGTGLETPRDHIEALRRYKEALD